MTVKRTLAIALAACLTMPSLADNYYASAITGGDGRLSLERWTYVQIDDSRSSRAFGLGFGDLTGDGYADLVSGKYFYRNPGGEMTGRWPRVTFPVAVDALLVVNVDDDSRGDVIALDASGRVYWLEAKDSHCSAWNARQVGDVGKPDHGISSQGYALGQLISGSSPEIIINVGAIYYFQIPANPGETQWPRTTITQNAYPEGVGVGDIDRDGDLDICGTVDNKQVAWWENPGNGLGGWKAHPIGAMPDKYADRFYAAELNDDGRLDIVVSAANGSKNGVYWWEQPEEPISSAWRLHTVVVQGTTNSMDVADMDGDGDSDIVAGEHRGEKKVAIWENDGKGHFAERVISRGKESHLGTRVTDLDGDGDLDIVSIAWDSFRFFHLWRNDCE